MVIVKEEACEVRRITKLIRSFIPNATLESDVSAELSYVLPQESKGRFKALFDALDERKEALKISSYGASVTTMEEVFIK